MGKVLKKEKEKDFKDFLDEELNFEKEGFETVDRQLFCEVLEKIKAERSLKKYSVVINFSEKIKFEEFDKVIYSLNFLYRFCWLKFFYQSEISDSEGIFKVEIFWSVPGKSFTSFY
jgi:predicted aldo/keto reductase-like oxidoreductase